MGEGSSVNPLLVILNARRIREVLDSIEALSIAKLWLTGYTERQLVQAFAIAVLQHRDYSHLIVVSDDCIISNSALDAVLRHLPNHPVVTGYTTLDQASSHYNLCYQPIGPPPPAPECYDFYPKHTIDHWPDDLIPTSFAGMALTAMTREMWQRFPFDCYGHPGWASDHHLSWRLQQAQIPIVAPKQARITHLKERWNHPDQEPRKRLQLGEQRVVLEAA